jgi:ribosome maturation factor RimP
MEYYSKHHDNPITGEIEPLIEGLGYKTVEIAGKKSGGRYHVSIIITKQDGIGLKDCEKVHKAVVPRLELILDDRDMHIEVSSPGISRNFKSGSEFSAFTGSAVRILLMDNSDWIGGTILEADEKEVRLSTIEGDKNFLYSMIRKAKLVDTQEDKA